MDMTVRAFDGKETTEPSPEGRRKLGANHMVIVDNYGGELAIRTTNAVASPLRLILPMVVEFPKVVG